MEFLQKTKGVNNIFNVIWSGFFRIVESWKIIVLLTVVLFILEEYLNTDIGKIELIKKMKYKIVDFIYYAICQYSIIYIFIALALNSNNCLWKIEERKWFLLSFLLLQFRN